MFRFVRVFTNVALLTAKTSVSGMYKYICVCCMPELCFMF